MIEKLANENVRLKNAINELSILNDIAIEISSLKSVKKIISAIIKKCIKHLHVEQASLVLLDKDKKADPLHTMIRKIDSGERSSMPLRLDTQLTGWILKTNKPLIINDLENDLRFKDCCEELSSIKSLLGVPLIYKGKITGVLTVFNKKKEEDFNDEDKKLLSIISSQAAQIIENARLVEEEKKLIAIKEELRMAREIQMKLLPTSAPTLNGYDIAAINIPAREVGGDYYDFIELNQNKYAICVGDITGKGLPAAMLMSNLQATIRGQIRVQNQLKECIKISNSLLYHSTEKDKFATFFGAILDLNENSITYCNAGHDNPIYVKNDKSITKLCEGGLILGFMNDNTYKEETIKLNQNEIIIIYSDGVTEAMNEDEIEFGEEKFKKIIFEHLELPANVIIDNIIAGIKLHVGKQIQSDDITLVIIKRN